MPVIRAEAMGLCFGVRDALAAAADVEAPAQFTILGELVHNATINGELAERGFRSVTEDEQDETPETEGVLITAHGVSDSRRDSLLAAGKQLLDTTCPLVKRAQDAARLLEERGYFVVVIGRRGHVELRGITGDLANFAIVESERDVECWPHAKLGLVCQTTTPPALVERIRGEVERRNPQAELRFENTVCQPTLDRQAAVERLVPQVELMVVVGGKNSHNTRQLVELCRSRGCRAEHVQGAGDLKRSWFRGRERIGLTAGTSTLDRTIDEVEAAIERMLGPVRPPALPEVPTSAEWCEYFEQNAQRLLEIPWEAVGEIDPEELAAVVRSVQTFQRGETGEGRHFLKCARDYAARTGDDEYVGAVQGLIAEENRHAGDLGRFLDLAGRPRLAKTWTDGVFRWLRHRAGLDLTISVLLTAEIIAMTYYRALRAATGCAALKRICAQILRDEIPHVKFQSQRIALLRRADAGWLRRIKSWGQSILYRGTCLVVWWTHRKVFRAAGMCFREFCFRTRYEYERAMRFQAAVEMAARSESNQANEVFGEYGGASLVLSGNQETRKPGKFKRA